MASYLAELMPGARNCILNWAEVKAGDTVAIVADTTTDPLVAEAFFLAAEEAGGKAGIITLKGNGSLSPAGVVEELFNRQWWPEWVVEAVLASDVALNLTFWFEVHRWGFRLEEVLGGHKTRYLRVQTALRQHLASKWATFPRELDLLIGARANQQAVGGKRVRVTDPEGTDITFDGYQMLTAQPALDRTGLKDGWYRSFGSRNVGLWPAPNCRGVIVTSGLHTGPCPTMKITVENGRAVHIEGGGEAGKTWQRVFEANQGKNFGVHPGPGVNWIEECMWATHPKAFRVTEGLTGPQLAWGWIAGSRRAGTLHFAFGGGIGASHNHRDVEVFFPTVTIDGKKIIEEGHLLVLDDPEIRQVASKYGDSDELLREDWIPEYPA